MDKILIASSGDNLDSKISESLQNAGYYLVVNTLIMDYEVLPGSSEDKNSPDISRFIEMGITKILTGNIDSQSFEEAISGGIGIYLCKNMTVSESIEQVKSGKIEPLKKYPS